MPSSPVVTTSLRGPAGSSWFRERGIVLTDPDGLRLYANEIHEASTRITRIWHTSFTSSVHIRREKSSIIFLQVEGTSIIDMDEWGDPRELRPGGFAVFPAGAKFLMRSDSEVVRYESGFDLEDLPPTLREQIASGLIENEPPAGYRQLVLGAANSSLNSEINSTEAGFPHFLRGFNTFLLALLVQTLESRQTEQPDRVVHLYHSALRVIEREFTDPTFTVTDLATDVGVSIRYLRKVFEKNGTSPRVALREARARVANEYLATSQGGAELSTEVIAHLSGFRDARALRRALEQHERGSGTAISDDGLP